MKNLTQDEVVSMLETFPLIPRKNFVYITMNKSTDEEDKESILEEQYVKEEQFVIAVGGRVQDIEPGMKVLLDPDKMTKYIQDPNDITTKIPTINALPFELSEDLVVARISDDIIYSIDLRD